MKTIRCNLTKACQIFASFDNYTVFFIRLGTSLKVTYSPIYKRLPFCRSICVKKIMKLLAFIFEQPSYMCTILLYLYGGHIKKLFNELYLCINLTDHLSIFGFN